LLGSLGNLDPHHSGRYEKPRCPIARIKSPFKIKFHYFEVSFFPSKIIPTMPDAYADEENRVQKGLRYLEIHPEATIADAARESRFISAYGGGPEVSPPNQTTKTTPN
jgi:hypothetical protein